MLYYGMRIQEIFNGFLCHREVNQTLTQRRDNLWVVGGNFGQLWRFYMNIVMCFCNKHGLVSLVNIESCPLCNYTKEGFPPHLPTPQGTPAGEADMQSDRQRPLRKRCKKCSPFLNK